MFELTDLAGMTYRVGILQRMVQDPLGTPYPAGAQIEVDLEANDLDDATNLTYALADTIVSLMNVATPGITSEPRPQIVYALDGPIPRPAYLFSPGWTPGARTWDLDHQLLEQLLPNHLNAPNEVTWRTAHAANNFRVSLRATDPVSRVPTTYAGLEFLNPLLEPKFAAGYAGTARSKGVAGYIESREGAAFEQRARDARNDMVHGLRTVEAIATDLISADVPTLQALRDAIIAQLGATTTKWDTPNLQSSDLRGDITMRFYAELTPNKDGEVAPSGQRHPWMMIEWQLTSSRLDPSGTYHANASPTFTFGLAEGSSLDIKGYDTDAHGGGVNITVSTQPSLAT